MRCGMCCDGSLFDHVPVEPEERAALEALDFDLYSEAGEVRFRQPCAFLSGKLCTVYADRPTSCRAYRCWTLKQFEKGEIDRAEALDRVAKAKQLIERVKPHFLPGESKTGARHRWARAASGQDQASPAFRLHMTALSRFLDLYFRYKSERTLSED